MFASLAVHARLIRLYNQTCDRVWHVLISSTFTKPFQKPTGLFQIAQYQVKRVVSMKCTENGKWQCWRTWFLSAVILLRWYVAWARISGPVSPHGSGGQSPAVGDDG
jgi:hypothetical protein